MSVNCLPSENPTRIIIGREYLLEGKLGHKFSQRQFLMSALSHESIPAETTDTTHNSHEMEILGKYLIQLQVTDYIIRSTTKGTASKATLESKRDYLCSEIVLTEIADRLNLRAHVRTAPNPKNPEKPRPIHVDKHVKRLFAAVFLDKKSTYASVISATEEVFYRLWNQYLTHIPIEHLNHAFPPSQKSQELLRHRLGFQIIPREVEEFLKYVFRYHHLLEQALTDRTSRHYSPDPTIGDSTRFQILGEAVLNVFLIIGMRSSSKEVIEKLGKSFEKLRDTFLDVFVCNVALAREYYIIPPRRKYVSDKEIGLSLFGAMYVDASVSHHSKLAFLSDVYTRLERFLEMVKTNRDKKRL